MAAPNLRSITPMILVGGFLICLSAFTYLYFDLDPPTVKFCDSHHAEGSRELSPYPRDIIAQRHLVVFDGAFFGDGENVYRGPAGPEVDAAWRDLGISIGPLHIATEDAAAMRIPADRFKVEDDRLGPSYLATVEVFHQIHCLDLLRKSLWFNADHYIGLGEHEFGNEGDTLQSHVTHCLDILRQVLMCNADVGLVPQVSVPLVNGTIIPFPDFSRPHQCRNFAAIKDWALENAHEPWHDEHAGHH